LVETTNTNKKNKLSSHGLKIQDENVGPKRARVSPHRISRRYRQQQKSPDGPSPEGEIKQEI
jgi:hypothetical protein